MGLCMIRQSQGIMVDFREAVLAKSSWGNWAGTWLIAFRALQVHKEGHFLAGQESGYFRNLEYKEIHSNLDCTWSLLTCFWLGFLALSGFKIQSEILYESSSKAKFKKAYMVNYCSCIAYVNNQVHVMKPDLFCK